MAQETVIGEGRITSGFVRRMLVRETHWGFVAMETPLPFDVDLLAEAVLKYFALSMILVAGAQWLLPLDVTGLGAHWLHLMLTGTFGLVGFGLYRHANRGFHRELQIDRVKREVRVVTRNTRDTPSVRRRIAMRDIESCFLRRFHERDTHAQLCIRLRQIQQPLELSVAPEDDLSALLDRMADALRAPVRKVKTRIAVAA